MVTPLTREAEDVRHSPRDRPHCCPAEAPLHSSRIESIADRGRMAMNCRDPRPRFAPRARATARRRLRWMILVVGSTAASGLVRSEGPGDRPVVVRGLTGEVSDIQVVVPEARAIQALADVPRAADVDLRRMA